MYDDRWHNKSRALLIKRQRVTNTKTHLHGFYVVLYILCYCDRTLNIQGNTVLTQTSAAFSSSTF